MFGFARRDFDGLLAQGRRARAGGGGLSCIETTACVEHEDCRDWGNRFCEEGLCRMVSCYYPSSGDDGCPVGSLCDTHQCRWLEIVPSCGAAPQFEFAEPFTLVDPDVGAIVVLDLDADGSDDFAVLEDGELSFVMAAGGASFDAPILHAAEPGAQMISLAVGDVHGDGQAELLIGHASPTGVEVLGAGDPPTQLAFVETEEVPAHIAILDVDYDGLPDLVTDAPLDQTNRVSAQIGDGLGAFGPLWSIDAEPPFEFGQPYPAYDELEDCRRALTSVEDDFIGARRLEYDDVPQSLYVVIGRLANDVALYGFAGPDPRGHVGTAGLSDRGVLFHRDHGGGDEHHVELAADPGAVALAHLRADDSRHVLIDYGQAPTVFVELSGAPLIPQCRGELGFGHDAADFQIGDFDGDGREDVLARLRDGRVEVWFSRP